jgi:hypothetical protein
MGGDLHLLFLGNAVCALHFLKRESRPTFR